ncbi:hypothetical protein ACFWBC_13835 [Streptomyces sp. NPDC059985]|uniref:hypothetical protein n=1 Tax=Streptomyces sp. NPDC059985 TaxID=3347025 RepID=UPI003687F3FB
MSTPSRVTLYSGPNYTGESCELPGDGRTYSLAATGLDKIASIKLHVTDQNDPYYAFVRLYLELPQGQHADLGTGLRDFEEDTPNTGDAAAARWLQASPLGLNTAADTIARREPKREIHDAIVH